jgi:hypothetical protein
VTTREGAALHHPQQLYLDRMKARLADLKTARADVERQGFARPSWSRRSAPAKSRRLMCPPCSPSRSPHHD